MIDPARYPRLSRIDSPAELRRFDESEVAAVADELRTYLIESAGKSGGHFGANLGVVELTTALHYLYDTPNDRLVWDVGHQAYPHKILTGRRDSIHTVKQKDGVAPFPKREESEYDTFGVGHSSTSISAALGMAIANQRAGHDRKVVAIIGDGSMTAGMAYEALNHAGGMDEEPNILVILNDNRMSISEAVGGLTRMLGRMTGSKTLNALREGGKKLLGDKDGPPARFVKRWEEHWKGMFVPSTLFEEMGFHYTGPIDGHDMDALLSTLKTLQGLKGPQLLHVITTKGKGYERAEADQIGYHAVSPFNPAEGLVSKPGAVKKPTYTDIFSDWLCDMAAADDKLLAITPAMREGSGLVRFSKEYPARYFDVAIQNLDVTFAIDRGGVVGPDGATHAGNLDLSYLRCVPNMLVMAASDEAECRQMLSTGYHYPGPAAVRYPRGSGTGVAAGSTLDTLEIGKAQVKRQGQRIALLAFGAIVPAAEKVGEELGLTVINMRFVKPLDRALIVELARSHQGLVTLEDNVIAGGAGSGVAELLAAEGITVPVLHLGLPDAFQHHASREDLLAEAAPRWPN